MINFKAILSHVQFLNYTSTNIETDFASALKMSQILKKLPPAPNKNDIMVRGEPQNSTS